ncbi:MAG: choice-of-anchor D domain-containing protein [Solirubrobacterales bacterium]|nr:choice-of-anchor D domain-containing protein [Solirubrobacterales bacterium]OJU94454.1 MAG: hypothetical protein BGO23_03360 [Solirubrobacterales bacterium 67-14]
MSFVKSSIAALVVLAALWSAAPAAALDFIQPAGSPYGTGALTSNSVLTGDLNGDGRDDVVTANAEYSFSVFLAGPNGALAPAAGSPFSTGSDYALSGTLIDFNGDGNLDVAIASNNKVRIFPGTGTGSFGAALPAITTPVNGQAITGGHFNSDSHPDLAVVGSGTDSVHIIFGDGAGGTSSETTISVGDSPVSIVAVDFDGDGLDDFATANLNVVAGSPPMPGAVTVVINAGVVTSSYGGYFQPQGISAGDYNGDGHQDFAVVSRDDQQLLIKLGNGSGGFTDSPTVPMINSQWGNSVASADFDGDGYEDLLVGMASNLSDPLIYSAPVFLGSSAGNLTASPDGPWITTSPAYPWEVATGDLNDDGHPDWVSGDQGGRISVLMNEAPALTANPTTLNFPDVHAGETSSSMNVTLTNTGIGPVEVDEGGVSITGTDAGDFQIYAEGCDSQILNSGDTCAVDVVFSPSTTGAKSATLNIAHDATGSPTTVALSGTGTANPGIDIDPTSHDFGNTRITLESDSQTFTVTSSGTTPLDIDTVTLTGANADQFEIDSENCTTAPPIASGGDCEVVVHFAPTTVGAKSASLSLTTNVPGSPQTVGLSGTGTPFGYPSWEPLQTDFGPVPLGTGPSNPEVFEMTVMGVSPLYVDDIFIAPNQLNAEDFSIVSDDCKGETIQPGDTCQVAVDFEPSATGHRSARLRYYADIYTGILLLEGEGTDPSWGVTPGAHDFGTRLTDEGPGAPQTFTLTSMGTTDLETGSVSLTGAAADQFQITSDDCSNKSIAPNDTCDISVAFAPTTAGEKVADLHIETNAAGGPANAQVTGSGQDPVPPPDPCEPVAIKKVAYFSPSVKKRSNIPGVRARVTTAGPAVVRVSSKVIYHLKGKQGQIKYPQRQLTVTGEWANYKVAIPKKLRKKLKPKKQVRFVVSYASKAKDPECTKFGPKKTRNLTTRIVWVIPNG